MRNGLSESEAGKLGVIALRKNNEIRKLKAIQLYNENPNLCVYCNGPIPYLKRFNKCCCKSHAASYSNLQRTPEQNKKIAENIKKYYENKLVIIDNIDGRKVFTDPEDIEKYKKIKYCKYCGCEKGKCIDSYVCKKHQLFKTLEKFGFDSSKIGTTEIINEYYKIRNIILDFYLKNGSDETLLKEQFNYVSGSANFHKILKSLDINSRNQSEAQQFSIEHNRRDLIPVGIHYRFKDEFHITWDNREVYLRSSYETDFANELDNKQIYYEVESLKIKYFDTQRNQIRLSIPDFYLPETNTIIEIKSVFTLNVQNMKDKVKAYKELGYNFKLILEHQEVDLNKL